MSKYIMSIVKRNINTYNCCVEANSEEEANIKMSVGPISRSLNREGVTLLSEREDVECAIITIKPNYKHDCEHCTFLGQWSELIYTSGGKTLTYDYDLYHCDSNYPTVIARYGNDGPDYQSGLIGADCVPCLREAKHRALELCLNCDVNSKKG